MSRVKGVDESFLEEELAKRNTDFHEGEDTVRWDGSSCGEMGVGGSS